MRYQLPKKMDNKVVWIENLKAIALAVVMGVGMAALMFFQLSK